MSKTKNATVKKGSLDRKYMIAGLLFLIPATVIYVIFAVWPFFDSLFLSFNEWNGFSPKVFVGLDNYIAAFKDKTFLLADRKSVV